MSEFLSGRQNKTGVDDVSLLFVNNEKVRENAREREKEKKRESERAREKEKESMRE